MTTGIQPGPTLPADQAPPVDELTIEKLDEQRWCVVHPGVGLSVLRCIRTKAQATREAKRLRTLIDWSTLYEVATPAVEALPGCELGPFGLKPRPAGKRWRLPREQMAILREEQGRILRGEPTPGAP